MIGVKKYGRVPLNQEEFFSEYRLMWIIVMFDLPTETKPQRKLATRFRKYLLDVGFTMSQYSIYMKLVSGWERVRVVEKSICQQIPFEGSVQILTITDKQYGDIVSYHNRKVIENDMPQQLRLF